MGTLLLTKEARVYNGAKATSSINGAGNIGQLHVQGAARENGVLCPKDTALGAASVLEGLLENIALCPATPEIRRLFTADTWSSVQTSHAQRNVIWCKK